MHVRLGARGGMKGRMERHRLIVAVRSDDSSLLYTVHSHYSVRNGIKRVMTCNGSHTIADVGLMASENLFGASNLEVEAQTIFRESWTAHDVDHS